MKRTVSLCLFIFGCLSFCLEVYHIHSPAIAVIALAFTYDEKSYIQVIMKASGLDTTAEFAFAESTFLDPLFQKHCINC
jgi:hypothetical protein